MITLRELCEELNITRRRVQWYEEAGLVSPTGKTKYGYLLYDEAAVQRVARIRFYQDLGFPVKEIGMVIDADRTVQRRILAEKIHNLELEHSKREALIQEAKDFLETL